MLKKNLCKNCTQHHRYADWEFDENDKNIVIPKTQIDQNFEQYHQLQNNDNNCNVSYFQLNDHADHVDLQQQNHCTKNIVRSCNTKNIIFNSKKSQQNFHSSSSSQQSTTINCCNNNSNSYCNCCSNNCCSQCYFKSQINCKRLNDTTSNDLQEPNYTFKKQKFMTEEHDIDKLSMNNNSNTKNDAGNDDELEIRKRFFDIHKCFDNTTSQNMTNKRRRNNNTFLLKYFFNKQNSNRQQKQIFCCYCYCRCCSCCLTCYNNYCTCTTLSHSTLSSTTTSLSTLSSSSSSSSANISTSSITTRNFIKSDLENNIQTNNISKSRINLNENLMKSSFQQPKSSSSQTPSSIISAALMCSSPLLVVCTIFLVFAFSPVSSVAAGEIMPSRNSTNSTIMIEDGVCQSIDIRNSPSQFKLLRSCRVIEGFLIISLIDNYNETDYDNLEFPALTEITDYFILYRVNGLKSLLKLFPNLRVIRGNNLLQDYAFIVYEMMNLHEIGLKSLTYIGRGGVRIEKNPMLCFVDTIDWTAIATNTGSKDHILVSNKPANECPICPSGKKNDNDNNNNNNNNDQLSDELDCPALVSDNKKRLCWNRQNCQKICPPLCGNRSCNDNGQCCDESCLGTCRGDKFDKCEVCRYLSFGDYTHRQCVRHCPIDTYEHHGRRCITAEECRSIPRSLLTDINTPKFPLIPFAGKCTVTCPADYFSAGESGQRYCKKCDGQCQKECESATIDSISAAQQYRGCSRIKGSVLIQIRSQGGHNVVKELETALSDIEVIEGSLKIVRSFPIVSLSFFKKLRIIQGRLAESTDRYSLYVMDNQNLQSLFTQNITIQKGLIFFHFNPKLCYSNIERLKDGVRDLQNVAKIPIEDVATNSNGDKVACNVTVLHTRVGFIASVAAILDVDAMKFEDDRVLLGYVLHYIISPYKNVSFYDGRDACGGDGWKVEDVSDFDRQATTFNVFIGRLKPYTQYAYYFKTYTIASEPYGGQSEIQYFTTLPDKPDPVRKLTAASNGSNEITISWDPPKKPNGKLTIYVIKVTLAYDDEQLLDQRNYCDERMIIGPSEPIQPIVVPPPGIILPKEPVCECDGNDDVIPMSPRIPDADAEQLIEFEDELQNLIYVKRVPIPGENRRRRRSIDTYSNTTATATTTSTTTLKPINDNIDSIPLSFGETYENFHDDSHNQSLLIKSNQEDKKSRKINDYFEYIYHTVNASITTYVVRELKHYSSYTISLKACREGEGDNCSNEVIVYQRTAKIENADYVKHVTVDKLPNTNNSLGSVKIAWTVPEKPNGIIVSYTIRYQRVDLEHSKGQDICITYRMYQNMSGEYHLRHLENGNYSFIVMATSLAGPGKWSPPAYFFIDESRIGLKTIFGAIVGSIIGVVLTGGAVWFFLRRKYGRPVSDLKLIASVNPEYVSMQYQPDEWEVPRDKINNIRELGQGSFGMVYEGIVKNLNKNNEEIRCAIKTVNENATDRERINFLKEAAVMKAFNTHHVVRLLGVVSCGQPTLVIMELMEKGDLKGYLRSHRSDSDTPNQQPPSLKRILQMAIEIADGMAYLSAKKFVHRDLAARNCMVAGDLTVKIGDFGMTRDIYETDYYRKGTKGLLPVRWMAPESLKDGVFSSSSDVFSFGVVLWEMATLASQPYQGLSNDQVLRYVIDGGVMERPENCPEKLYRLMCRTWQHRPSSRPSFLQIVSTLLDDAVPSFRNVSFYHSHEGQELLQQPQHQSLTIDVTTPLKAEEDDFSLEGVDESYLMELRKSNIGIDEDDGGGGGGIALVGIGGSGGAAGDAGIGSAATHSPLSGIAGVSLKRLTTNLPDIAMANRNNSPANTITQSTTSLLRTGNINRGLEFLRNAFFGYGGSNITGDTKEYRKLNQLSFGSHNLQPQHQYQSDQQQRQYDEHNNMLKQSTQHPIQNGFVVQRPANVVIQQNNLVSSSTEPIIDKTNSSSKIVVTTPSTNNSKQEFELTIY